MRIYAREEMVILRRFLTEQAYYDQEQGKWFVKAAKEIKSNSLQSAYEQDATFRKKAGKKNSGYVLNLSETCSPEITSCDFGGNARLAKRVIDQGIGWLVGKTVHQIDGPHRWPRPYFYSLKKFGPELKDSWVCSQMFHNMPYEQYLETEGPATLKVCRDNDCLFIPSVSGIGTDYSTWIKLCKDMEAMGGDMIELDTGGPHATFGAMEAQKDVGAPLALDPDTAYAVTKACVDAVKIPIIFKMTPQCVNSAALCTGCGESRGSCHFREQRLLWNMD